MLKRVAHIATGESMDTVKLIRRASLDSRFKGMFHRILTMRRNYL